MTALIAVGLIAATGVVIWALSWAVTWLVDLLDRSRRAPRFEPPPLQLPGLGPMTEADVAGTHDWDGFAAYLEDEYRARLREQQIEIPREGEVQQ